MQEDLCIYAMFSWSWVPFDPEHQKLAMLSLLVTPSCACTLADIREVHFFSQIQQVEQFIKTISAKIMGIVDYENKGK